MKSRKCTKYFWLLLVMLSSISLFICGCGSKKVTGHKKQHASIQRNNTSQNSTTEFETDSQATTSTEINSTTDIGTSTDKGTNSEGAGDITIATFVDRYNSMADTVNNEIGTQVISLDPDELSDDTLTTDDGVEVEFNFNDDDADPNENLTSVLLSINDLTDFDGNKIAGVMYCIISGMTGADFDEVGDLTGQFMEDAGGEMYYTDSIEGFKWVLAKTDELMSFSMSKE